MYSNKLTVAGAVSVSHRTSRLPNVELNPELAPDAGGDTIDKLIGRVKLNRSNRVFLKTFLAANFASDQRPIEVFMFK